MPGCTLLIIGLAVFIVICRIACRNTEVSKWKNAKTVAELNENRQGSLLDFLEDFTNRFPKYVDDYETLLTDNRIWKQRTVGIGVVTPEGAGTRFLRCDAARFRHRVGHPQEATLRVSDQLDFDIPVGVEGDCYDRYLCRIEEMRQSNRIIKQCIDWLRKNPGPVISSNHKVAPPSRERMKGNMEEAHPPLQALHRRYARSAGRGLCSDRASEG